MTFLRQSTEVAVKEVSGFVAKTVIGLLIMAGGGAIIYGEYFNPPVHTTHLFAGIAVALLGAGILPSIGDLLFAVLKKLGAAVKDFLPLAKPGP